MSDPYFTTFHGPIVGELWRHETGCIVEVVSVSKAFDSTVVKLINGARYPGVGNVRVVDHRGLATDDANMGGTWGAAPFARYFTRVP